jgi:Raf kinase inhibitor-like YbhB/YbcL family protein
MRRMTWFMSVACIAATPAVVAAATFKLESPTIKPGATLTEEQVYNGFGCDGKNLSPALRWSGAPEGTKSFAVTLYDPDAPTGSGWWHWVVFNIPASATSVVEGAGSPDGGKLPPGSVQGPTDFGAPGFGGACPPKGDKPHRYIFTVYALKTEKLEVPAEASGAVARAMIHGNALGSATLTAKYGRK